MMQVALQLAVLGKPHITYKDQVFKPDLISAKGQALLIFLAVTGRSHSRTALAGLLWGDMPEETARANLRLTLSKLRKFVPEEILQADRREVGLAEFGLDAAE
jgi:DNA-binding SARP family transcriptional activator